MVVKTAEEYTAASEFKKMLKERQKAVNEAFDPIIKDAHAAWKKAIAQRDTYLQPYVQAENEVNVRIKAYLAEEDRKQREAEARVQEMQRKEAEKLQKRAEKAAEKGQTEKAEQLQEQAQQVQMVTPVVQSNVPKVEGMVKRKIWKFKIVDKGLIPREYMMPDEVKIGAVVRAMKSGTDIPGIQAYEDLVI
ncbi:MAG TPA: hypothetical protein P5110_09665 [Candidatus Omnitrophota bacterium]|nr:hypothetical protein [Candidatus Omnitrophota bacterium]